MSQQSMQIQFENPILREADTLSQLFYGKRYFTPYGFYACRVTVPDLQGETIHIKILLVSERDGSQPARVCRITGTSQAIKKERLSLIMDIHKWAQFDRDDENYWVAQMEV